MALRGPRTDLNRGLTTNHSLLSPIGKKATYAPIESTVPARTQ